MQSPELGYKILPYSSLSIGDYFTNVNPIKYDFNSMLGLRLAGNAFIDLSTNIISTHPSIEKVYLLKLVSIDVKPIFLWVS